MTTFPFGYSSTRLTLAEMESRNTWRYLDPEFRRRFAAMMVAAAHRGIDLGVGTGWRVQPNPPPPGFAKPGNSHHESMPIYPNSATAQAIDAVPATSWSWMEANVARFGLRTFRYVNDEPWHVQPYEIPASRNYRTTPYKLNKFELPDDPVVAPPPPVFDPVNRQYALWPLNGSKAPLAVGSTGDGVKYLQAVLRNEISRFANWFYAIGQADSHARAMYLVACRDTTQALPIDGNYGPKTAEAVTFTQHAFRWSAFDGQAFGELTPDGKVGSQFWPFIDINADGRWGNT